MNSEYKMKQDGNKLLVLLIVSLIIFLFGSVIISSIASIPLQTVTHLDSETLNEALSLFSSYYDNTLRDDGLTWAEYAQSYFNADPILFDNIRTFYCAVQFLSYMPLVVILFYCLRHDFVKDFKDFLKN